MAIQDLNPRDLRSLLDNLPISKWGFADISGLHPLAEDFPKALSLALSYTPEFDSYNEEEYHALLHGKRNELNEILQLLSEFLRREKIPHFVSPDAGQDNDTLMNRFPHKLAATRAGLGWIGKNSLLITKEYGPRVRLGAILLDYDLPVHGPVTTSGCGECELCVEACPYDCLHNAEWYPGMNRTELFDPFLCHHKRNEFIKDTGRKHECGFCLLACPVGRA